MKKKTRFTKERRERMAKALELKEQGATYDQIASTLGISRTRAFDDVDDALKEITREPAESLRDLELRRIDRLWQVVFKNAMQGNLKAVDRTIKLIALRMKLLGLDVVTDQSQSTINVAEAFSAMFQAGMEASPNGLAGAETNPLDDVEDNSVGD